MVRPRILLTHYVTQGEALFKQASKGAGPSNTSHTRTELTLVWGCSKLLCLLLLRITEITQLFPWLWAVDRVSPVFVNSRPTKSPSQYTRHRSHAPMVSLARRLYMSVSLAVFYLTCLSLFLFHFLLPLFFSSHPSLSRFFICHAIKRKSDMHQCLGLIVTHLPWSSVSLSLCFPSWICYRGSICIITL